jgi:hypothetical protein
MTPAQHAQLDQTAAMSPKLKSILDALDAFDTQGLNGEEREELWRAAARFGERCLVEMDMHEAGWTVPAPGTVEWNEMRQAWLED